MTHPEYIAWLLTGDQPGRLSILPYGWAAASSGRAASSEDARISAAKEQREQRTRFAPAQLPSAPATFLVLVLSS